MLINRCSITNYEQYNNKNNALRLPIFNKSPIERTNAQLCFPFSNLSKLNRTVDRAETDEQIVIAPSFQTRQRDGVYFPEPNTFVQAYKMLDCPFIPSKTKEISFQILNRTLWTANKAFKSNMKENPNCNFCDQIETMEHLLYQCEHHSALVWEELGLRLTETIRVHSGVYVPRVEFTPLHIIFNKPHPSIHMHLTDKRTKKTIILLIHEIKRDIYFRRTSTTHRDPLVPIHRVRIQAHILTVIKKITHLLTYQGMSTNSDSLLLLNTLVQKIESNVVL